MPIKNGDVVRVHYTGTLDDGTEFDSSRDRDPLEFTVGKSMVIPGFERAVEGREPGETVKITIPPEDAYGDADPEMVFEVDRAQVPPHIPVKEGTLLTLTSEEGHEMNVAISAIDGDVITLDANHPLAGKALTFEITIVDVK